MSVLSPEDFESLPFYLSYDSPCSYRPGQSERKLFVRLTPEHSEANARINGPLCRAGFRRSQDIVYRPACEACNACVPVRVPVDTFVLSRSLCRVARYNQDLSFSPLPLEPTDVLFALFSSYLNTRHADSDMAAMNRKDFSDMLLRGQAKTQLFSLNARNGNIKGVMIADDVGDGFSAVYSFFTPDEPKRSLGSELILRLIDHAKKNKRPFVYLGFWIKDSPKMAYKNRFRPLEFLGPDGWTPMQETDAEVISACNP